MSNVIYYFSGTGNSLSAAKDIASKLSDTELLSIPKEIDNNIRFDADKIGIVFPVYAWGMPLIVNDFIKKFSCLKGKYLFAVATYGGLLGGTLIKLKKELNKIGVTLNLAYALKMPGNYTPMKGADSKSNQEEMFKKETTKIDEIVLNIKNSKDNFPENTSFLINWIFSGILNKGFNSQMPYHCRDFFADDKCIGCRICERICPVNNIHMEDGRPVWSDKCQQCMACLQWCPVGAVEIGKKTQGKKRYTNPNIKVEEFFLRD